VEMVRERVDDNVHVVDIIARVSVLLRATLSEVMVRVNVSAMAAVAMHPVVFVLWSAAVHAIVLV
jgi:hypothetical protein